MREIIQSKDNQWVKLARKVRDQATDDLIFIEGKRLVREAIASDMRAEFALVSEKISYDENLIDMIKTGDGGTDQVLIISDAIASSLGDTSSPQGIFLIAKRPPNASLTAAFDTQGAELPLSIVLDRINDPSNLGAVLRTAEAAGARAVILTRGSTDAFSPKAIRASMGSCFRISIIDECDLKEIADAARSKSLRVIATSLTGSKDHTSIDWSIPSVIIFGSEAHGISKEDRTLADESIRIDMSSPVESLNLAVSTAIILFEARRQVLQIADTA